MTRAPQMRFLGCYMYLQIQEMEKRHRIILTRALNLKHNKYFYSRTESRFKYISSNLAMKYKKTNKMALPLKCKNSI